MATSKHTDVVVVGAGIVGLAHAYIAAFALDFGGLTAGATASGVIDGVGYLGGSLAGVGAARVSVAFGWRGVFAILAVVSLFSALASAYLWFKGNIGKPR